MKKCLFMDRKLLALFPLRCKIREKKSWAKVFKFFFKLADWNGDFWPNLNQVIYYLNCVTYSRNAILMQKFDQTFIKPSKFLGKFFVKIYIWANSHLLITYREQWLLARPDG